MEIKEGRGDNSLSRADLSRELEVQSGGRKPLENCGEGPLGVSCRAQKFAACAWTLLPTRHEGVIWVLFREKRQTKSLDAPLKCFVLKVRCFCSG